MAALHWVLVAAWLGTASLGLDACPARCSSCKDGVAECWQRSLVAPPKDFPEDIQTINLDGNHLRVLGRRSFQTLLQLEVLRMKGNKLRAIKRSAFRDVPNLITLDLSNNQLVIIEVHGLEGVDKLRSLSLQHNKIRSLSRLLDTTPNLYQLNIGFNSIQAVGRDDLKTPTRLHYLDLRHNRITSIHPEAFSHLKYLRYLFLNNNPLVKLPDMMFGSNVLQLADFSNCKLTHVPRTMPSSITEFRLSNNKIMQINDTDFKNITHLRLLALNDNELHFIANNVFANLPHLTEIWLRNNKLVYVPRGLPDNLRKLHMDSNRIQEIEDGLFSKTSQLDYLTVENNKIHRISNQTFVGLLFLKSINLRSNVIHTIEMGTFSNLGSLTTLTLSDNPLQKVQERAFHMLPNLTHLLLSMCGERTSLDQNFLPEMPSLQVLSFMNSPGLAKAFVQQLSDSLQEPLPHLKELDLTYSDLTTLTSSVRQVFPHLQTLALDGNSWLCDRRLAWLQKWMAGSDVSFWKYEEVMCEHPVSLKGRTIKDLGQDEFVEVSPQPPFLLHDIEAALSSTSRSSPAADPSAAFDSKSSDGSEPANQPETVQNTGSPAQSTTNTPVRTTSQSNLKKKRTYRQKPSRRGKQKNKANNNTNLNDMSMISPSTPVATTEEKDRESAVLQDNAAQKNPDDPGNKHQRKGRKNSERKKSPGKSKKKGIGKSGKGASG